jgi:hypothetical protein
MVIKKSVTRILTPIAKHATKARFDNELATCRSKYIPVQGKSASTHLQLLWRNHDHDIIKGPNISQTDLDIKDSCKLTSDLEAKANLLASSI